MSLQDEIRFFAKTDIGRVREHNEDNFLVDKKLSFFVVADGMGGHAAGEVASALAVRTLHEELNKARHLVEGAGPNVSPRELLSALEQAVQRACAHIHEEALGDPEKRGMGTTLSALLIVGHRGFIAHVGDSRIYLMRDDKLQQLTEDHTVANELLKRGKLSREQIENFPKKHAITRAVGVYERVDVDMLTIEVLPGDQFLLASDGLHGYFNDPNELASCLRFSDEAVVDHLIQRANDAGGKDNITAIVIRLPDATEADGARARQLAQKREVLAKMPLFARLSERELLRVMQVAAVRSYPAGTVILEEGSWGDELFIVLSGRVVVSKGDAVLTTLGAGEHVGEMALIRSTPRSATVSADEGSAELVAIRRADFFEILRREPELAVKLLWQFVGVLANRLDQTSKDLHEAREELGAEDLTDEVFPDFDEG